MRIVSGTLALGGELIDGATAALCEIGKQLEIHLLTADTQGRRAAIHQAVGLTAARTPAGKESEAKAA